MSILISGERKTDAELAMEKWIYNALENSENKEDRQLNNFVHANGIRYVMDNYIYQDKKENKDKEFIETLQNITDIFLSLLSIIDSIKFHSSDYIDALEMGMKH